MHRICLTAMLAMWPVMAPADSGRGAVAMPLAEDTLDRLRWQARPVVVLGPTAQVAEQIAVLQSGAQALAERDVVLLTDGPGADRLRNGTAFQVVLIGKDGGVKMRQTQPVSPDQIIGLIDSMPMRKQEAR